MTTRYLLGGEIETDNLGGITRLDVSGPAGDLAHYSLDNNLQWVVSFSYPNGHGDLGAEADLAGTLNTAYDYTPFGEQRQGQGYDPATRAEPYTATWDKKHDPASQLIEMGARPYDPQTGRFLSVDPIVGGAANTFDYAGQDPVNRYDLSGRCGKLTIVLCNPWNSIQSAAAFFVHRKLTVYTNERALEKAARHGLDEDEIEASLRASSGRYRGFKYTSRSQERLGFYDTERGVFVATTRASSGRADLVNAFRAPRSYVDRLIRSGRARPD